MAAIYKDINQRNPRQKHLVLNEDAVLQSLRNIFRVKKKDVLFGSHIGNEIKTLLFQLINKDASVSLFKEIQDSVSSSGETRVNFNFKDTTINRLIGQNKYDVSLRFTINGMGGRTFGYSGKVS